MLRSKPIICGSCKKDTGYTEEQFMFYVATSDVLCPHCGAVIIQANRIEYTTDQQSDPRNMSNKYVPTPSNIIKLDNDFKFDL